MRKMFVANWKMNSGLHASKKYVSNLELVSTQLKLDKAEFVVCPSFPYLHLFDKVQESGVLLGVQDVSAHKNGAYTGEVSSEMLKDFGVNYCIIGHSERRRLFAETSRLLQMKLEQLEDIVPIYCIGETIDERDSGSYLNVLARQLEVVKSSHKRMVVAYEPVWAIGSGISADNQKIDEIFDFLRSEIGDGFAILYGGSVNAANAKELCKLKGLGGFLVGNASLNLSDSMMIYNELIGEN